MKLKRIEVKDFKSIGELNLPIDEKFTTLVGANEHGKTNILLAIRLLDSKTPIGQEGKRSFRVSDKRQTIETSVVYEIEFSKDEKDLFNSQNPLEIKPSQGSTLSIATEGAGEDAKSIVTIAPPQVEEALASTTVNLKVSYKDETANKLEIVNTPCKKAEQLDLPH